MNAVDFNENFGHLANAPNGIEKIRQLILVLATSGRLSERQSSDISVEDRLVEYGDLLEEQRIRKKEFFEVGPDEISCSIPEHWKWVRFSEVAEHNAGRTLDKRRNTGTPRKYITTSNLYWGRFDLTEVREMLIEDKQLERCTARKGDLLICEGGEAGRAAVWESEEEICFQNHIHRARLMPGLDSYYAYRVFVKLNSTGEINEYRKGVGISNMSGKALASIAFPLPPLEEQKRIVAKVDELMALCDKLEDQRQEREHRFPILSRATHERFREYPLSRNLDAVFLKGQRPLTSDVKESILSLAISGSLVAQRASDGLVHDVLQDLESQGGNESVRRGVPSEVAIPEHIDVYTKPETWEIESTAKLIRLGAIVDLKDGNHGANHPKVAEFTKDGLPFITAANVSDEGAIDYEGAYKLSGKPLSRLRVGFAKPGDVIYTHKGSVGRVSVCTQDCVLSPQTTYYRPNPKIIDSEFLRLQLLSPQFRLQVDEVKTQTTRDFVSIKAQYNFFIRIPPLKEQRRIVSTAGQLFKRLKKLEGQLLASSVAAADYARAIVVKITGSSSHEAEPMKTPKTELVSNLRAGKKAKTVNMAPLANLLQQQKGELSAKTLWQQSGLEIDAFYLQLRTEIAAGWIAEPKGEDAYMKELAVK